jgi:hypothetical protein
MPDPRASRPDHPAGSVRLEVYRVKSPVPTLVRTLSDEYIGIGTHFVKERTREKGRSRYCPGKEECTYCRTSPVQWKGYFPAEVYEKESSTWIPWVFELTEASEVDVRGKFGRGQCWFFAREKRAGRGGNPVVARFGKQLDCELLRPAFEVWPVLRTVYGVQTFDLLIANPTPDRVFLPPSTDTEGVPSAWLPKTPTEPATVASQEEWRKARQELNGFAKMP